MQINKKYLIVIEGPTAVGKTELGIKLAQYFNTEIISADSRQFYDEMSIGTAKPTVEELNTIKHHFIGHISINADYNAGKFEIDALEKLHSLFDKFNVVILVGGSGLYINALCNGIDEIPSIDSSIRESLNASFQALGLVFLQNQLKELDPVYYQEVDLNNHLRIIRALEVTLSTGIPFSSFRKRQKKERFFSTIKIGLNLPREILYDRINRRVDQMLEMGLEAEVKSLFPFKHLNALRTVGYSEFFDYFEGITSYETSVELIKQHTRNFAKRQLTWFNKDKEIKWFQPDEFDTIIKFIQLNTSN